MLGNEHVFCHHGHAPGAAHAEHMPVVDDLVLGLVQQAHAVIDHLVAGEPVTFTNGNGEHVPVGDVDAAGEVPAPADDEARGPAFYCLAAALRIGDAGGNQRLGVG